MNSEVSIRFNTCQYIIAVTVIFLVNCRYVFCNLFDIPSFPLTIIITLLLLLGINYKKVDKKELALVLLLVVISALNPSAISILSFVLCCYVFCRKYDDLIMINFFIITGMLLLSIIFYKLGMTHDVFIINQYKEGHSLGFKNPNSFSLYVFSFLITLYVLAPRKYIIPFYFFMVFISIITFLFSGSRTTLFGVTVLILVDGLIHVLPKSIFKSKILLYFYPILLCGLSIYFCLEWRNFGLLDVLLSGRLSIMGSIIDKISPFQFLVGFPWPSDEAQDNAYITMLSSGGLAALWIYFSYYKRYVRVLKVIGLSSLPLIFSILLTGLTEYVFVGLNMISITLILTVKKLINHAEVINNSAGV